MRLAELIATFAVAADAGMGMPMDHGLRSAAVAVRLGELAGAADEDRADAFYLALLRYVGCTADSDVASGVMGDEVGVRGALYGVDWGAPAEVVSRLTRAVARGRGVRGVAAAARALVTMPRLLDTGRSHCEVGDQLAVALGFGERFRTALRQTFERWDGKGFPDRLKGEAIALSMRLAHAGEEIECAHQAGGVAAAAELLARRARRALDPRLAALARSRIAEVCAPLEAASAWTAAMELEPGAPRTASDEQIDQVLRAMGDFADLKSRFTRGHSRGVARLARFAAAVLGLPEAAGRALERAASVHDLGRVAVSAGVWDKPGPLNDGERERVRLHTYVGERILARAPSLESVAAIATLAHERIDGSGYHRRLGAPACTTPARVLAAADVFHALTEPRPHRPARTPDQAAATVIEMASTGALCAEAVRAVLAAAGHADRPRPSLPAGLTVREIEVLRAVARGLTNKEVAATLDISSKTVSRHLESVFSKIGVTTRAAATMFAMQRGVMG